MFNQVFQVICILYILYLNNGPLLINAAVSLGSNALTKFLIETGGANVNERNYRGQTPLHIAINRDHVEIARLLIDKGADVNERNDQGLTPLDIAVIWDKIEIAHLLIDKGADVNVRIDQGLTPLLFAMSLRKVEIAHLLIDKGADVNVRIDESLIPLLFAMGLDKIEIARLLIEKSADVNVRNDRGITPLHIALFLDEIEFARFLIDKGADVNVRNDQGNTALHYAVSGSTYKFEFARLLIDKGADVNSKMEHDLWHQKIIEEGKKTKQYMTTEMLREIKESSQITPLHVAAMFGHVSALHLLVENGANIEAQTEAGLTALHFSTSQGHTSFYEQLITRYHVDINVRMTNGTTSLGLAREWNRPEIARFLLANGGIL